MTDWIAEARRSLAERRALAAGLASGGGSVRLFHLDGRSALAGPDMSSVSGWRLTRFDTMGPVGHTEHGSLAEAVEEGLRAHYRPRGTEV